MHESISVVSPWLVRFASYIPKNSCVLDLACGAGRHANYLAQLGLAVLAVDRDVSVFSENTNPQIQAVQMDLELEEWPLDGRVFSAIVVTNYLYRSHLDKLPKMLISGGILIYETFAKGNAAFGKPSNPNFLLEPGELLSLAMRHDLRVLAYEDLYLAEPKPAKIQRICAVKGQ